MSKKILILNANPNTESYGSSLAVAYKDSAEGAGHKTTLVNLVDLKFDYNLQPRIELEPDLVEQQELIKAADHIVVVTPMWWGSYPAVLKAYFDRVLTSGFAFKHPYPIPVIRQFIPRRLLKGRTARVIVTQDQFRFVSIFLGNPIGWNMRWSIFWYVGISKVRTAYLPKTRKADEKRRARFTNRIRKIAARAT